MTGYERAQELADKLTAAGVRAALEPAGVNPPAVYVPGLPGARYDLGIGKTAVFGVVALAGGPSGPDRTTWTDLQRLCDAIESVILPMTNGRRFAPGPYQLQGTTYTGVRYVFEEVID